VRLLQACEALLASARRVEFGLARGSEDPAFPAVIDWAFRLGSFPHVTDPTGRFIKPQIEAVGVPPVDFFALAPIDRLFPPAPALICDGKPVRFSLKRMSRRLLFRHGRYVIKIGEGSLQELRLDECLAPEDRKNFLCIAGYGRIRNDPYLRTWVAQPMIPLTHERYKYSMDQWADGWKKVWKLVNRYHIAFHPEFVTDAAGPHPRNWTLRKGVPVVYDFGGFQRDDLCARGRCDHDPEAPAPPIIFR